MKFQFRLEVLKRQRKLEQDVAQREYLAAQQSVRDQLTKIEKMYQEVDSARELSDQIQSNGGPCADQLQSISNFISGQKVRIENERFLARNLMAIEEEKHEILTEKMRAFKVLENLKSRKQEEHRLLVNKKEMKAIDDLVMMNFNFERKI